MNSNQINTVAAYVVGTVILAILLAIAIWCPYPSEFQYTVFRIVLALAAAAFAICIPGSLDVKLAVGVTAGGALAVFVLVFFFSPAGAVVQQVVPNSAAPYECVDTTWVIDLQGRKKLES